MKSRNEKEKIKILIFIVSSLYYVTILFHKYFPVVNKKRILVLLTKRLAKFTRLSTNSDKSRFPTLLTLLLSDYRACQSPINLWTSSFRCKDKQAEKVLIIFTL